MSEPETPPPTDSALGHLKQSWVHAENLFRCYMEKAGDELHRRLRAAVQAVLYPLLAGVLGLVGVVVVASGFSDFLQSRIPVPGAGNMIVGAVLVAVALTVLLVHHRCGRR